MARIFNKLQVRSEADCAGLSVDNKYSRYRQKHREKRNAASAEWWKKNGDDYRRKNRERLKLHAAEWRRRNPEEAAARVRAWREANPDVQRECERRYRAENPQKRKESVEKYRSKPGVKEREREQRKIWAAANKDRLAMKATARRAMKLRALPSYADESATRVVYLKAQKLSAETGIEHHVDHIVPLKSPIVCGLHWHGNLQILTSAANLSKNNRYWPDMW